MVFFFSQSLYSFHFKNNVCDKNTISWLQQNEKLKKKKVEIKTFSMDKYTYF